MKILITVFLLSFGGFTHADETIKSQVVDIQATEKGFEPSQIDVKPGTSVILKFTRKTDKTCATTVQIPAKKIKKKLPLNETISIVLGKLEKGEIRFACGMNMMEGQVLVR